MPDCCMGHLFMSVGVDAGVLVVARQVRSGQPAATVRRCRRLPRPSIRLPLVYVCMYACMHIWCEVCVCVFVTV